MMPWEENVLKNMNMFDCIFRGTGTENILTKGNQT